MDLRGVNEPATRDITGKPAFDTRERRGHQRARRRQAITALRQAARQMRRRSAVTLPWGVVRGRVQAKRGHVVHQWRNEGRQALAMEAARLGLVPKGLHAVGPVGQGAFRSWQTLTVAIRRKRGEVWA